LVSRLPSMERSIRPDATGRGPLQLSWDRIGARKIEVMSRRQVNPHPCPPPLAGEGVAAERRMPSSPPPQAGEGWVGATVGSALERATVELERAGLVEPRRLARRLLAVALGLSATEVFAYPEKPLATSEQAQVAAMLR